MNNITSLRGFTKRDGRLRGGDRRENSGNLEKSCYSVRFSSRKKHDDRKTV